MILTDEEVFKCLPPEESALEFARAIEAAVLEKLKQQEPVAWQDTAKPSVLLEHDQLDPMWQPIMRPLYAAPVPAAVPDGWKLVPVEPTQAMYCAANEHYESNEYCGNGGIYRAMLSAAPAAPAVPDDVVKDAERYRYLRDISASDWLHNHLNIFNKRGNAFDDAVDGAIDAAMQKGGAA